MSPSVWDIRSNITNNTTTMEVSIISGNREIFNTKLGIRKRTVDFRFSQCKDINIFFYKNIMKCKHFVADTVNIEMSKDNVLWVIKPQTYQLINIIIMRNFWTVCIVCSNDYFPKVIIGYIRFSAFRHCSFTCLLCMAGTTASVHCGTSIVARFLCDSHIVVLWYVFSLGKPFINMD